MWLGMALSGSLCCSMFLLAQMAPETLLRLFTTDEAVIAAGCSYLRSFSLYFALEPIFFCLNGLFLGAGHTLFALSMTLGAALLVRIPAALALGLWSGMGLFSAGLAAPLASIPSIACALLYYFSGKWKNLLR